MDKDIFQKVLQAAVGFAEKAKEKTEEVIERLVKQGKISADDGQHIAKEVLEATKKGSEEAMERIASGYNEAKEKFSFAHSTDLQKLRKRVDRLEKKLQAVEVNLLNQPAKASKSAKKKTAKK